MPFPKNAMHIKIITGHVLTTTDSNVWGDGSGHTYTYTFTRHPNGTTDIDGSVVREGKNLRVGYSASYSGPSAQAFLEKGVCKQHQGRRGQ
jgi:hypothetical protein